MPLQPAWLREGLSCLACLEEGVVCTVGLKAEAVSLSPLMLTGALLSDDKRGMTQTYGQNSMTAAMSPSVK